MIPCDILLYSQIGTLPSHQSARLPWQKTVASAEIHSQSLCEEKV